MPGVEMSTIEARLCCVNVKLPNGKRVERKFTYDDYEPRQQFFIDEWIEDVRQAAGVTTAGVQE